MTRGPREVNFLPRAIDQGGERDFSGQVESEVNINNIVILNYIKFNLKNNKNGIIVYVFKPIGSVSALSNILMFIARGGE